MREELEKFLCGFGYKCRVPMSFKNLAMQVQDIKPDLVLLDLNLPYESGFQVCREIKRESSIPILILTSRDTEEDEVNTLNLGADDFITKPFNKSILLARIKALLRRTLNDTYIVNCGWFSFILDNFTIIVNDNIKTLPSNEGRILNMLVENQGNVVSRKDLCLYLWDSNEFIDENTLSVNITRLRKDLKDMKIFNIIETIKGKGYKLRKYEYES